MTRQQQLKLIYRHTHRDYRGTVNGVKSILVLRPEGTCLVPLDTLTDTEIANKLPGAERDEAKQRALGPLKEAQALARSMGMTIASVPQCGEFVVNFACKETIGGHVWGGEASAYYATDLDDAIATMKTMYAEKKHAWTLEPRA